jgi:hypothetical protein
MRLYTPTGMCVCVCMCVYVCVYVCVCVFPLETTVDRSSYCQWFTLTFSVLLLPLGEQYLFSVYWAVVTISTTGYRDIFAVSQAE